MPTQLLQRLFSFMKLFLVLLSISFTTQLLASELRWFGSPTQVSDPNAVVSLPSITINDNGQAIAVWQQRVTFSGGTTNRIYASTHTTGGGWATPTQLPTLHDDRFIDDLTPQVALNESGQAVVVWDYGDDDVYRVGGGVERILEYVYLVDFATNHWSGRNWVPWPVGKSTQSNNQIQFKLDINNNGQAIVAHQHKNGNSTTDWVITATVYTFATDTWSPSVILEEPVTSSTIPDVSFNDLGQAFVTWISPGNSNEVGLAIYQNGTWGSTTSIASSAPNAVPSVITNSQGETLVAWTISGGNIFYSTWTSSGGWAAQAQAATGTLSSSTSLNTALNDNSQMYLMWIESGGGTYKVRAASSAFSPASWTTQNIVASSTDQLTQAKLALDNKGEAVVNWLAKTGASGTLFINQTSNQGFGDTSWSSPRTLSDTAQNATGLQLVANHKGAVLTSWANQIEALFGLFQPTPPGGGSQSAGSGRQIKFRFPTFTEYVNRLEWVESDSHFISYYVKLNGQILAKTTLPFFEHHAQKKKKTRVYQVTTVNALDHESDPITITVN